MDRPIPPIPIAMVRFAVLFLASFLAWSALLLLVQGAFALRLGCALSDVLAAAGVIAAHQLDRARAERSRRLALTTAQEFPAIPMPLYLVPLIPPLYEAEIMAYPATVAERMGDADDVPAGRVPAPMPQPVGMAAAA